MVHRAGLLQDVRACNALEGKDTAQNESDKRTHEPILNEELRDRSVPVNATMYKSKRRHF